MENQVRIAVALLMLMAGIVSAQAASTDVVFRGGLNVTSTSGCTGWNPDKQYFTGTYWVPVAGSTNGPDSVLSLLFPGGGGEGFELRNGAFSATYKTVNAHHIFTRVGTYLAQLKISIQNPTVIATTTPTVSFRGTIKGFDNVSTCLVNFSANLIRQLDP
jgi:hypothetical protein